WLSKTLETRAVPRFSRSGTKVVLLLPSRSMHEKRLAALTRANPPKGGDAKPPASRTRPKGSGVTSQGDRACGSTRSAASGRCAVASRALAVGRGSDRLGSNEFMTTARARFPFLALTALALAACGGDEGEEAAAAARSPSGNSPPVISGSPPDSVGGGAAS